MNILKNGNKHHSITSKYIWHNVICNIHLELNKIDTLTNKKTFDKRNCHKIGLLQIKK